MKLDRLTSTSLLPRVESATAYRPAAPRDTVAPVDAASDATADRRHSQEAPERRGGEAADSREYRERMRRNARRLIQLMARLGNGAYKLIRTDRLPPNR
ncbi:MAG: hypothetical protein ACM31P_13905, partial [Actinomycetota bacterium]